MEHKALIRKLLIEKLSYMGINLDAQANQDEIPSATCISTPDSNVAVFVIPTNEELMIAKETSNLMQNA